MPVSCLGVTLVTTFFFFFVPTIKNTSKNYLHIFTSWQQKWLQLTRLVVKFYVAQMFKLNDRQKVRAGKGVNSLIIRLQFQRNFQ